MQTAAIRTLEFNPAGMARLYRQQFELCALKPGETVAIVSDLGTRREYVQAAFAAADELGARTVAFPAVSAGIFGWPMDDAARIAVETVRAAETSVEEVTFVLFDEAAYEAFDRQVR